jgi:hypothetical protein
MTQNCKILVTLNEFLPMRSTVYKNVRFANVYCLPFFFGFEQKTLENDTRRVLRSCSKAKHLTSEMACPRFRHVTHSALSTAFNVSLEDVYLEKILTCADFSQCIRMLYSTLTY